MPRPNAETEPTAQPTGEIVPLKTWNLEVGVSPVPLVVRFETEDARRVAATKISKGCLRNQAVEIEAKDGTIIVMSASYVRPL